MMLTIEWEKRTKLHMHRHNHSRGECRRKVAKKPVNQVTKPATQLLRENNLGVILG